MKRSNQEVSDESPFDQKRGRCSQLIDTLTTPKQTSIFTESIFNESIDPAIVEKLLCSNVLKRGNENGDVWELRKFFNLTDESVQLRKLCRAKGRVKYKASPTGYGRVYAQKGLSLALLRKQVRGTLCNGVYVDWDMVNAHPTILLQLLRRNCADRPELWRNLEQYCVLGCF